VSNRKKQGCQIFLGPNIPNWENYNKWRKNNTKRPKIIPNGHKTFQMVSKSTNIYPSKALQNLPRFVIFGLKTNHPSTLVGSLPKIVSPLPNSLPKHSLPYKSLPLNCTL
jgi:hypothetical protein